MKRKTNIWSKLDEQYRAWGISGIPFTESASEAHRKQLHRVFTGREAELRDILTLFKGANRRRVLIHGWYGIGKTAFLLEVLNILQEHAPRVLTAYTSLPPNIDLATAALTALAEAMPRDPAARQILYLLGVGPRPRSFGKGDFELTLGPVKVSADLERGQQNTIQYPILAFQNLLERAYKKYNQVVIAIDDLDKQEPSVVRELLLKDESMLKGGASFIVTGHPGGLIADLRARDVGLFDLTLELAALSEKTSYDLLANYLDSVRIKTGEDGKQPHEVYPFTREAARLLCREAEGIPRWLNRLGYHVMRTAVQRKARQIGVPIVHEGIENAKKELFSQQNLTQEDYLLLELVESKEALSDENVTLEELGRLGVSEFSELKPMLDRLVDLDMLERVPTHRVAEYHLPAFLRKDDGNEE